MKLQGKTIFITGASRGIGKAIALRLAHKGANVAIVAKSTEENPKLGGTIYSTAYAVDAAGGKPLAIACDIRDEDQIIQAVQKTVSIFGGIDVLINNASAINLANSEQIETKRFDLIYDINVRGTFLVTRHCVPFLREAQNPHIITLSPPLSLKPRWLAPHLPYTLSKFNMSMMTLGWAEEFRQYGIAANSIWPATTIATAAVMNLLGGEKLVQRSRKPEIVAEAVYHMIQKPSREFTGNLLLDEDVLHEAGITDFSQFAVNSAEPLQKDLFLE